MPSQPLVAGTGSTRDRDTRRSDSEVGDRALVVRNHDGNDAYEVDVRFLDADGDVVFRRVVAVAPLETVTVRTRLEPAVYRVVVRTEDVSDRAECHVGNGIHETALVETGNGAVSVVEGL